MVPTWKTDRCTCRGRVFRKWMQANIVLEKNHGRDYNNHSIREGAGCVKKRSKKRWLRKYDGKKYGWFLQARDFTLMLIGLFIVFSLFVGVSRVSGQSMVPTLRNGEPVFFTRINFNYSRDEVVFAKMPSGSNYVKRIVAVPGDTVDIREGVLYVNGQQEVRLHHIGDTYSQEGIVEYPYTVPEGCFFLVGDNREGSVDSRSFGALPAASIKGKLIFVK